MVRGAALALLALCLVRHARATEVAGATLVVGRSRTASDCPDAAQLASAVQKLGSPPASPRAPLFISVYFDGGSDGYGAHIEATGREQGERVLETPGTSCDSLAQATAVALAVLIDLLPARAPAPALAPTSPVSAPVTLTRVPPVPAHRSLFMLGVGVDWALAYGLLGSNLSITNDLALRGRYRSLGFELSGTASTPHYESVAPGAIRLNLSAAHALGCVWPAETSWGALGGCAGLGLGSLTGHARGYDRTASVASLWTAAIASLNARLRLRGRWGLTLALSGLAPLRSQAFVVAPSDRGFHSAPAAVALRFGPELQF